MTIVTVPESRKEEYNKIVTHPLQSWEWGEFRKITGIHITRLAVEENDKYIFGFTITFHPVPKTTFIIGYMPKTTFPPEIVSNELKHIAKKYTCIFIQLEPDVIHKIYNVKEQTEKKLEHKNMLSFPAFKHSAHPLFTKYTLQLDLTKTEEELLAGMHPKTRYNIKIAKKHGVEVTEDNSNKAFEKYWELTEETTRRQKFYAHTKRFHEIQWETFPHTFGRNKLSTHLFVGKYQNKILTTFLLFVFNNRMYYTYGATSDEARNTMHSTLTMWEAIRFGKSLGLTSFDMWGSLGPNPNPKDPWYGFTRFKNGYGGELVEFIGSYDYIASPMLYKLYQVADKARIVYLKLKQ